MSLYVKWTIGCLQISIEIRFTHCLSLTSSFLIKSLASSEISLNASSSKSYLAIVTLAIVSTSVSPMNGDKPDNLQKYKKIVVLIVLNNRS